MPAPDPKNVVKKIRQSGIMPVFYHEDPEICTNVIKACHEGGIRVFEFANRGARAEENYMMIKKYVQRCLPDMYVGLGDLKDVKKAGTFIDYQADFIASPVTDPEIGVICREKKVLWIPGCYTPTEIALAEKHGATLLRLLPGNPPGPSFISAMKPLFPALEFMPAEGVEPSASGMIPWLESGVTAISMGNKMITPDMLARNDYDHLREHVKKMLKTIRHWRKQSLA